MRDLKSHTNDELRARINKGQSQLDTAHKIVFTAWHTSFMNEVQRSPAKYTKAQLIAVFEQLVAIYKQQRNHNAEASFEHNTSPWLTQVRNRAARIRDAYDELKRMYKWNAPVQKLNEQKAKIKAAIASR